jgi:hypothetical protein
MRYEFQPDPKRKDRNQFVGSWEESPCKLIDLPFASNSLEQILIWGAAPEDSPHTHQEIAHWCDRMHMALLDVDCDPDVDRAVSVAADVDCQWDLFLANTYKLEELQTLDFASIRLPVEWFNDWLKQLRQDTEQSSRQEAGVRSQESRLT